MPIIDRSDLKYDYVWDTEPAQKPRRTTRTEGETGSRMFRRDEGDDVLDFINEFSDSQGFEHKEEALEVERLLRDEMKNKDMTRKEVRMWLQEHINKERV